jgi:hypothetical protein
VYAGLVTAFVGLLTIVRPMGRIGLTNRACGAALLGSGVLLAAIGIALPVRERRVASIGTRLDEFIPVHQFSELHSLRIAASPERVYLAIREVTAGEISLFQLLTRIRRLGRSGTESILNAPDDAPILDVATRTGFVVLADDMPTELVVGTVVIAPDGFRPSDAATAAAIKAIPGPGFATAVMNFRIVPDGAGVSKLSTETRVFATDAGARRRFAAYWRFIYPGSALIRRGWLRAIRRRAEAATGR